MKVYILIGMIGSGKSSWARMTAGTDFNTIRVGVDDIRNMIKDKYTFDFQLEPLVNMMKIGMIREVMLAGKNVVIDDIHLTKEGRIKLCEMLSGPCKYPVEIIYVWMKCNNKRALKRRLINLRGRDEFEWRQVMLKHEHMFDVPNKSESIYIKEMIEVDNNEQ